MGDHDELTSPSAGAKLAHHQFCDPLCVEIVLWLIQDERFHAVMQYETQHRGASLPGRSRRQRLPVRLVLPVSALSEEFHGYYVVRDLGSKSRSHYFIKPG